MKLLFVSAAVLMLSAALVAQPKPWVVPPNFKAMKNPVATSEASVKAGLALYTKNCASCHGKAGLGDGVKARALKEFPGDFSKAPSRARPMVIISTKPKREEVKCQSMKVKLQTMISGILLTI